MQTDDFFRARIDAMINLSDPLAVLATRLDWAGIETSLAAKFERRERAGDFRQWLASGSYAAGAVVSRRVLTGCSRRKAESAANEVAG